MANITFGITTFFVGLIAYTAVMIASYLYHRRKKKHSFIIEETENEIIVKRSSVTGIFNAVAHFFFYSLITVFTIANKNEKTVFIQIAVIYIICLVAVLVEYYLQASFRIVIDKQANILRTKDTEYQLQQVELEISDCFRRTDDYDAYGLYIKTSDGKSELLYGTSVLWDIKELKTQIDGRLNSHQLRFAAIQADEKTST